MSRLFLSAALGLGLILSGCSGGGDGNNESLLVTAGTSLVQVAAARRAERGPKKGPIVVTRRLLDATPGEVLEIRVESTGNQDFPLLLESRTDGTPGVIEVWKSSDNALIVTRSGVVINTRGLGGDMKSADVSAIVSGFDGQGGGGERRMMIARPDGIAEAVNFSCDVRQLGREVIQIVDQRVSTYRLREDCIVRGVKISNEYWAETAGGRLRKSRQWISPSFGYATLTRLKN